MVTQKTDYGFIKPTEIEEEMRVAYLDYAMSVIVSRALPDIGGRRRAVGNHPER